MSPSQIEGPELQSIRNYLTMPFSLRNNLVCRRCTNWANYCNIKVTWQKYGSIVCLLWWIKKYKFCSLKSEKCFLYEIVSIIKSLVNSNLDLNSLYKYMWSNFWQTLTILENFYCSVYEVISQRKWPSSYECYWRRKIIQEPLHQLLNQRPPVINLRLKLFFFNCILHASYKRPFLPGKLGIIFLPV